MPRIQGAMAAVTLGHTRHRRRKARTVHRRVLSVSTKSGDRIHRELFNDVQELWAVRMPHNGAYRLRQVLSKSDSGRAGTETGGIRKGRMRQNWADFILKQRKEQGIFNVVSETLGAHSLLLLAHEVSPADLPEEMQNLIAAFQGSFTRYTLVLNYHNYSYKEVLSRLLPQSQCPLDTRLSVTSPTSIYWISIGRIGSSSGKFAWTNAHVSKRLWQSSGSSQTSFAHLTWR